MANICFIANFDKTYFFSEIAKKLKNNGHQIYWVSTNSKLSKFLEIEGFSNILNIQIPVEKCIEVDDPNDIYYKYNELIMGDRVLRDKKWSMCFLRITRKKFLDFARFNKINYVIGELTWAHEILISRLAKFELKNKLYYLNPHTMRLPKGFFLIFSDEYQNVFYKNKRSRSISQIKVEKPEYFDLNNKLLSKKYSLKGCVAKILSVYSLLKLDCGDPTIESNVFRKSINFLKRYLNYFSYKFIETQNFDSICDPFVFYALHRQPEASVDVLGRYYEDQFKIIENISRFCGDTHKIVVKEHPNAIGDRNFLFYKKIKKIKNVFLVSDEINTYEILEKSSAVFSISGTVAYEAGLLGIPSFTFADCFFNKFGVSHKIDYEIMRNKNFSCLIGGLKQNDYISFMKFINEGAFEGIVSDPLSNPGCMSIDNIFSVSSALQEVIESTDLVSS